MFITPKNLLLFFWISLSILSVNAQEKEKKGNSKKKTKTITDLTKKSQKIEGLFTVYQDSVSGSIKMLIREDQLDKDYIYFSQIADGIAALRTFRGSYRGSRIINIKKYFNKIEFIVPNTSFYFDPNNPLSKSAKANISDANIASLKILAMNEEKNEYLVDASKLFLSESLTRIKPPKRPKQSPTAFTLGKFDKEKSKIIEVKNYPKNTNIKTEYVYNNPTVLNGGGSDVTDGRNVAVKTFHTFMNMPEDGYEVRYDDPRVGYFTTQVNDMTSAEAVNYKDLVHRWRLVKKNPNAAISEPVTPITWWIENSTPMEWRDIIKEGVLEWNAAFEKAGFKNAVQVKIQPDNADWDAGDVRYNVLRWTSSPNPPFGGYGPSFVNPRTGEILGADIMLEFVHFTNRVKIERILNAISSTNSEEEAIENVLHDHENFTYCSAGHLMHEDTLFGQTVLNAIGATSLELEGLKKQSMMRLIMHEVGHTLGLNHNMKGSHLFSPEELANPETIKGKSLSNSVMEYPAINIVPNRAKQGQYYDVAVGPYDTWAIQFGYTPFKSKAEMDALLAESTKPELIFGNDADDMRSPGKGIDPRVMTGDLSNDPITYGIDRIELVNDMIKKLRSKMSNPGESYQELRNAFYILNGQAARAGDVISRYIGGVYIDRGMNGQKGATKPYTPVKYKDQKRAMEALSKYIFAPDAFKAPNDLYNYLAAQRRGYNFFRGPEDPKIHDIVLRYQKRVLDHILHPNTLQRISDSELYGNKYELSEFMTDLNDAIFKGDIDGNVNSFRQNLQTTYTNMLLKISNADSKFTNAAKSMALYNLTEIGKMVNDSGGDISTKAHKNKLNLIINNNLNDYK